MDLTKVTQETWAEVIANMDVIAKQVAVEKGTFGTRRYEAINALVTIEGMSKTVAIVGVNFIWDDIDPDPATCNFNFNETLLKCAQSLTGLQISRKSNCKQIVTTGLKKVISDLQGIIDQLEKN